MCTQNSDSDDLDDEVVAFLDDTSAQSGGASLFNLDVCADAAGDLDEPDDPDEMEGSTGTAEEFTSRARRSPDPAKNLADDPSFYAQLVKHNLLTKLTQIVLVKAKVPPHLRADATQEMHVTWALLTTNPKFERNQMARYAYMSGQHAALKLMRTLGAVVCLPGALFSSGKNVAFLASIGAATNPKDIEDFKDSLEVATNPTEQMEHDQISIALFNHQVRNLSLTFKQKLIAEKFLVGRIPVERIAQELQLTGSYVERILNLVAEKLYVQQDRRNLGLKELVVKVRAPRKARLATTAAVEPDSAVELADAEA